MRRQGITIWILLLLLLVGGCGPGGRDREVMVVTVEVPAPTVAAPEAEQLPTEPAAPPPTEPAASPPTTAAAPSSRLLRDVEERGRLICGVNGNLPGFSKFEDDGTYTGFDADFCRVVAAAIFGDADAIEFRQLNATERFKAVRNGEVDVLFRNTTWTASRDNDTERLDFGPTTFHDGQGFMFPNDLNITSIEELEGRTICVTGATTTQSNLRDQFRALGIEFEAVVLRDTDETFASYDAGACEAVTADRSQLVAKRTELSAPDAHTILDTIISREPLGPVMVEDDSEWRDVVTWAVFATIYAEELGVNQENVDDQLISEDPNVRRLLGLEGNIGENLGLEADFAYNIVREVGNYADIYERNLGADTPFDLDRGPNKAWNRGEGGVLSSPPFR